MRAAKNKNKLLKVKEHLQAMAEFIDVQIALLQKNTKQTASGGTCATAELSLIRYQSRKAIVNLQLVAIEKLMAQQPITSTEYELLIKDRLLNKNSLVFRRIVILDHNKKNKAKKNKRTSNDVLFLAAKKPQTMK